jgi:hypothetical protein
VAPVRAFPISAPDDGIGLVDPNGHELAWIDRLSDLPDELRTLVEGELASREFMPVIKRIRSVSSFATPSTWEVETDRGPTNVSSSRAKKTSAASTSGLLIADSHGIHFLIRDRYALDRTAGDSGPLPVSLAKWPRPALGPVGPASQMPRRVIATTNRSDRHHCNPSMPVILPRPFSAATIRESRTRLSRAWNDDMKRKTSSLSKIRHLRGPNIWTYRPVLEAVVDIGELEDFPSNTIPGFYERLTALLPSLIEHRCSYGERGGFLRRVAGRHLAGAHP